MNEVCGPCERLRLAMRLQRFALCLVLTLTVPVVAAQPAMTLETLTELVQQKAAQPYDANARAVPTFLNELGYDQYRDFQYKPEQALWHDKQLPFELTFFHSGYLYKKSVDMHALTADGSSEPILFTPALFDYGPQEPLIPQLPPDLGFSGFHLWWRDATGELQPVGLFQGASYYRMVSSFHEYGLSARALAVNTNDGPEEFPDFTTFWLQEPAATDTDFVFYGLAEGPSVVAGYRFVLTPGAQIRLTAEARLVLRQPVKELGLTPYSTMFWYGENSAQRPADFRPEVHDSDGLLIVTDNEQVWRPLVNPPHTRTDILPGNDLQAFALLQRDRDYEHYQDIEADYHLRPDTWIVPGKSMQSGSLHLLEIESPHEYADNVALLWSPATMPQVGEVLAYDYEIHFGELPPASLAEVVATRYGESLRGDGSIEFVVDFGGAALDLLNDDSNVTVDSSLEGGTFVWQNARKNPHNDTWRMTLRVLPNKDVQEMRLSATLKQRGKAIGETWQYWWMADR
ncbi:MAG: glucan biosynthesis protein [Pseudomonadota bacterium]